MSTEDRGARSWLHDHRFTVLLVALLLHLLVAPALSSIQSERHPRLGEFIVFGGLVAFLVTALAVVSRTRATTVTALLLALPALTVSSVQIVNHRSSLDGVQHVLTVAFLGYLVWLMVRYVFGQRRVTTDLISAALCAYLLIGLTWSSFYALIDLYRPGSFHLPDDGLGGLLSDRAAEASVRRVYFSFVTLLTLGYGDLVPVSPVARLSAIIEAFVGQVFLVVLVARLVGIQVAQSVSED